MEEPRRDFAEVYGETLERIRALLVDADPSLRVPATPEWTVKDVIAHLAGVLDDITNARLDGVATDPWTDKQVEARRERSLEECIEEWEANFEKARPLISTGAGGTLVADVVSHEHDLRAALGKDGERDGYEIRVAARRMLKGLDMRIKEDGLPCLRVVTEAGDFLAGEGEPAGTVTASSFEVLRGISGRRTPEQVRRWEWEGDPDTWLASFFMFGPAEADVTE